MSTLDDPIVNIASLMTRNGSFWVISSEIVGCGACPFPTTSSRRVLV